MKTPLNVSVEALEPRLAPAGIVAVDTANQLHSFDSATPGNVTTLAITGLAFPATEKIMGIDYRPATGQLYALGIDDSAVPGIEAGRIYTIDPATGVATQVGNTPFFSTFANDNDYAFEVDPVTDRLRVISDRDNNLRVNPDTGALILGADDAAISPAGMALVGVAHSNNVHGGGTTTLYGIDLEDNALVLIGGVNGTPSPNAGAVSTIGALGVTLGSFKAGFDIEARTGNAFAVLKTNVTGLYTINLSTGAATLVGAVGGDPFLHGMTVALPAPAVDIVNNTTATYIDDDGDKVTIQITGAPAGAAFSPDDFQFSVGQFGSRLVLDLSDDGQEWAKANITINAVPVGSMGDSFVNVSFINAAGVDLGKVTVNGDLGRIDAGLTIVGNTAPGLASLTVQSFGVSNTTTQTSTIVGKLGGLTVKSDFGNGLLNVTDTDGAITAITIAGNLDGRGATGASGISATQSIGNVVINGSVFGGGVGSAGNLTAGTKMGNLTIGGSVVGGTADEAGIIVASSTMGNVLIKGSVFGGTQFNTGVVFSGGNMGSLTIKGSVVGGAVVDPGTDTSSGRVVTSANMGAVVIGGNLVGGTGYVGGNITAVGSMKSVSISGSILGGSGIYSGSIQANGGLGNVTVAGDVIGGSAIFSGTLFTENAGSMANVTIGGSLIGSSSTGILSTNQIGIVKITGEVSGARISAEGGTGSPAKLLGIKSITIGQGVTDVQILAGYNTVGVATNTAATLGPVTVGGNWVTSDMKAGAMGAITINGNLDGRGAAGASGIFSLSAMGNLSIGGNLYGGGAVEAGLVDANGAMGTVTIGGSIFGGTASRAGRIEAGATMGNVLVKGSIFGGTDDRTGNVFATGNMGSVTVKGSIIGGMVADGALDFNSGLVHTSGNMGAVVIGANLIGSNSDYSGGIQADGFIKAVTVNGYIKGGSGDESASIVSAGGIGNVIVLGDLIGGSSDFSGSISVLGNGSLANVTIGGSLIGGSGRTGIMSHNQIGAVKIAGGLTGGQISAEGGIDPANASQASAIKSVAIGGTVQNSLILGGYTRIGTATNPDAMIGAVTVGGNWIASSLAAGVNRVDNFFGNDGDVKIAGEGQADSFFSSIASLTIKGYATGSSGGGDHFGITAEQVGTIKIGVQTLTLAAGTDTVGFALGTHGDFRVREV